MTVLFKHIQSNLLVKKKVCCKSFCFVFKTAANFIRFSQRIKLTIPYANLKRIVFFFFYTIFDKNEKYFLHD